MKNKTDNQTASASQNRAHTWNRQGFCIYCHNVHQTDSNARSTCSDGFTCAAPAAPESPTANFMDVIQNFREAFETTRESARNQANGGVLITHEAFTALDFAYAQSDEPYTLTI